MSNWIIDNVVEGDELTMTRAAGTFVLSPTPVPLLAFAGGSGITPILSLAKSALATADRAVRILCADRDRASVIFEAAIDDLVERYPGRLSVHRHIDAEHGLLDPAAVEKFVGADTDAHCYVCGPGRLHGCGALRAAGRCAGLRRELRRVAASARAPEVGRP